MHWATTALHHQYQINEDVSKKLVLSVYWIWLVIQVYDVARGRPSTGQRATGGSLCLCLCLVFVKDNLLCLIVLVDVAWGHPNTGQRATGGSRIVQSSCTVSKGSSCHLAPEVRIYIWLIWMVAYWCHIDANLMLYWCHIDAILMPCWCHIDAILMPYWCHIDHRKEIEGQPFHREDSQDSRCRTWSCS